MFDPYWIGGTAPLWTTVALAYCFAAVYLRIFDNYEHPQWVWGSFLMTGMAIFLLVNHQYIFTGLGISVAFELFALIATTCVGIALFLLARDRARSINELARAQDLLCQYRNYARKHGIDLDETALEDIDLDDDDPD